MEDNKENQEGKKIEEQTFTEKQKVVEAEGRLGEAKSISLQECIVLNLYGRQIEVKFPSKIKQQLEIETNKSLLSNGSYALLSMTSVNSSNRMLDIVDALSHFLVVIPDLHEVIGLDKNVKISASDLDFRQVTELVKVYNTDYARFYNQFVSADQKIGSFEVQKEN